MIIRMDFAICRVWLFNSHLFGYVECSAASLWVFPVTAEGLAQYGVVGLLQALGFLVETGKIPLDNRFHSGEWVLRFYSSVTRNSQIIIKSSFKV